MKSKRERNLIYYLLSFVIGVTMLVMVYQHKTIQELEDDLSEVREELYIKNDIIKQINMRNEREFYMERMEEKNE